MTFSVALSGALFLGGLIGGALNSVAGGGSFIVFPTVLFGGVAPVAANATTTVALWPAGIGSAIGYRKNIPPDAAMLAVLSLASIAGGAAGAKLLLATSDLTFVRILPALLFVASFVFTFGPSISKRFGDTSAGAPGARPRSRLSLVVGGIVQLVIATYGGYFGGGMGILMLATFTLMGMRDLHAMNAIKVIAGLLINGVALVIFVAAGGVEWAAAVPVGIGAVVGGYAGAAVARRIDPSRVRVLVLVFAWGLTSWFFVRAFLR